MIWSVAPYDLLFERSGFYDSKLISGPEYGYEHFVFTLDGGHCPSPTLQPDGRDREQAQQSKPQF